MRCWLFRLFSVVVCLSVLCLNSSFALANEVSTLDNDIDTLAYEEDDTSKGQYNLYYHGSWGTYDTVTNSFSDIHNYSQFTLPSNYLMGSRTDRIRESINDTNPMANYFREQFIIYADGSTVMCNQGERLSISIDKVKMSVMGYGSDNSIKRYAHFVPNLITEYRLLVMDKKGNYATVTGNLNLDYDTETGYLTIGADFDAVPFDVYKANILFIYKATQCYNNNYGDSELTSTSWVMNIVKKGISFNSSLLTIKYDDNTTGLLSSIIGFIKSILEGVVNIFEEISDFAVSVANSFADLILKVGNWFSDLFSKLGNWFSSLFSHILEIPSRVWDVFETGLKKVFVPSTDYIEEFKGKFDTLLKDRFGFLYESFEILNNSFGNISSAGSSNNITIPSVSTDLAGTTFTLGGWTVPLVPNKFAFLLNAFKLLTNGLASFVFMIGMKNKFTKLMEGRE